MTAVIIVADGGIAAGHILAVDLSRDGDVLSDGEAEDILGVGEGEAVAK